MMDDPSVSNTPWLRDANLEGMGMRELSSPVPGALHTGIFPTSSKEEIFPSVSTYRTGERGFLSPSDENTPSSSRSLVAALSGNFSPQCTQVNENPGTIRPHFSHFFQLMIS